jgi:CsoR family transcriptional regulator, copper-sensing transcriptional repressor
MKIKNNESKEILVQRLKRIEGQVRGVQGMIDEERDCQEIIQQLSAIRSALQGASRFFLQEYAATCLLEMNEGDHNAYAQEDQKKREKMVHDMIVLLDKAP